MSTTLTEYYRCPDSAVRLRDANGTGGEPGFFLFGGDVVCFGNSPHARSAFCQNLTDVSRDISYQGDAVSLPFDPTEIVANLRDERYVTNRSLLWKRVWNYAVRKAYYSVRPLLSVPIRRQFQKLRLRGWRDISFPSWPVDTTVDRLHLELLRVCLNVDPTPIPFIWFWPDGADACAVMTHDVETQEGVDFCPHLMDINDSYGIPASFQVVPERRYAVTAQYLASLRERGFEINVQDLNHDGHLFQDRETFCERVGRINNYGKVYGACGFRAAVLYHRQEWYDMLAFDYDMSISNVGHLDPQRGGCCTVMPYYIGRVLELPVTTTQDYTLFHILNDYSLDLWKEQMSIIHRSHGLISFIVHPDYIIKGRPQGTYCRLLEELNRLRTASNVWVTLPGETNRWWRQRSQMRIVQRAGGCLIEGSGSDRARLAFATMNNGTITYRIAEQQSHLNAADISKCLS